jgi:hypothetical protein
VARNYGVPGDEPVSQEEAIRTLSHLEQHDDLLGLARPEDVAHPLA